MDVHDEQTARQFRPVWVEEFSDPMVRAVWAEFYWANAVVDRGELVRVDSGQWTIPIPDHRLQVGGFATAVAYLVHGLEGAPRDTEPGRYLERVLGQVVPDPARPGIG